MAQPVHPGYDEQMRGATQETMRDEVSPGSKGCSECTMTRGLSCHQRFCNANTYSRVDQPGGLCPPPSTQRGTEAQVLRLATEAGRSALASVSASSPGRVAPRHHNSYPVTRQQSSSFFRSIRRRGTTTVDVAHCQPKRGHPVKGGTWHSGQRRGRGAGNTLSRSLSLAHLRTLCGGQ